MVRTLCLAVLLVAGLGQTATAQNVGQGWQDAIVPGGRIGEYRHGTFPALNNNTHVGYDIVASCGTQIRSWKAGRVIDVIDRKSDPNFNSLGYMVLLEHASVGGSGSEYSLYLHMKDTPKRVDKTTVAKGAVVAQGETIGMVGDTGAAQGCHLHFEGRRFATRFNPTWNNIYGPGDKRSDQVFLRDWFDPGRGTPAPASSQTTRYDAVYVDNRGVVPGVVRLPPQSVILTESLKCDKVPLRSIASLVPRSAKCVGQVTYNDVVYMAYPNWMRNASNTGAMRIVVGGVRPQVLADVAAVNGGYIAPILVDGQHVEFLSVAPQRTYVERTGHPYLRYRVTGTPGQRQLQLIATRIFASGTSPIELNRRSMTAALAANTSAPDPAASVSASPSSGRVLNRASRSPADVFLEGNPNLDRVPSDRACGSVRQDGVISNMSDFFACDEPSAIRALQAGRRIVFTPQGVSFSQGKFIARMSQHAEKVQAAKRRLSERENGSRNNQGYMDDFGVMVRAQPFSMTCDFGSRQVSQGQSVVTMAKLISFSGRSAVLECR